MSSLRAPSPRPRSTAGVPSASWTAKRHLLLALFIVIAGWSRGAGAAHAQQHLGRDALEQAVRAGVQALEQGRAAEAADLLQPVVQQDSAFIARQQGTAAYWLGQALLAQGAPGEALRTWSDGLSALRRRGQVDVTLADAFVREVHRARREAFYPRAERVYEWLVRMVEPTWSETTRRALEDDLQALALILPDTVRERVGLPPAGEELVPSALATDAGRRLVTWWRGQDPLPATPGNERLHEHLERSAQAFAHYASEGALDDRGRVYVRLGGPTKQARVDFDSYAFRRKVLDRSRTLHHAEFKRAEFWIYQQISDASHFLFVEETEGRYHIGHPDDMIPSYLGRGSGTGVRGFQQVRAYVLSLEHVYRQLAVLHGDYNQLYADIAEEAMVLDNPAMGGGASVGDRPPHAFASRFRSDMQFEDEQLDDRREAATPRARSAVFDEVLPLPVAVRTARFLEPDGSTRTELYWSAPSWLAAPLDEQTRSRFGLPHGAGASQYLMEVTVVQYDADHRRQEVLEQRHALQTRTAEGGEGLGVHTVHMPSTTEPYYLAAQWDQFAATATGEALPAAQPPPVRLHHWHSGALHALQADSSRLEMSDLKPVRLSRDVPLTPLAADSMGHPFPQRVLRPDSALVLYFEVYHLAFGAADRTRYRVTYEVEQQEGEPPLLRFWQEPPAPTRTAATTSFEGTERTAREMILMDLQEGARNGPLTVNVRVTDETTGQAVERSIRFDVREAE